MGQSRKKKEKGSTWKWCKMMLKVEDITSPRVITGRTNWNCLFWMCLNVLTINLCRNQQQQEAVFDKSFAHLLLEKEKTVLSLTVSAKQ